MTSNSALPAHVPSGMQKTFLSMGEDGVVITYLLPSQLKYQNILIL